MIPSTLRIVLIIAVVCYFVIILYFLKNKSLQLKYTLLWLAAGIAMGVMVIWPEVLTVIKGVLGIESNMNALFMLCIALLVMLAMALTSIVSKQTEKIKELVQESARLEKRVRELEDKVRAKEK